MDLFFTVGISVISYVLIHIILFSVVDCDLKLLYSEYFGKNLKKSFKGKVIWVTGSSSGIGEFLAVEFAKYGAKLVLSARSVINLERVKQRCLELGTRFDNVLLLPFDLTDINKHEEMFSRVLEHFGKLDILVNNAGRSQRALWEKTEMKVDYEMFQLNVFSVISLSRLAVQYFEQMDKRGHLVVTSSLAGFLGVPFSGSYSGSKHALHNVGVISARVDTSGILTDGVAAGYFKALMTEKLGSNISVTLLCPGPVFSNSLPQSFTAKSGETYNKKSHVDDRIMPTRRCAYLSAIAVANRLDEAWIGLFPVIPLTYILVYFPNIAKRVALFIGAKQLLKIRDSRPTVATGDN